LSDDQQTQYQCSHCNAPLNPVKGTPGYNWPPYKYKIHDRRCALCAKEANKRSAIKTGRLKPKVDEPILISSESNRTPTVITTESLADKIKRFGGVKEILSSLSEAAEITTKHLEEQENQTFKDNRKVQNRQKVDELKGYLHDLVVHSSSDYKEEWQKLAAICEINKINNVTRGFEKKEAALAWKEYYPEKYGNVHLLEMIRLVASWISIARKNGVRFVFKELRIRVCKYFISNDPKDYDDMDSTLEKMGENIETGRGNNKAVKTQIEKEKEKEQEQVITVDNTGHQQAQSPNEDKEQGGENQ
jgi:hypothetical protein